MRGILQPILELGVLLPGVVLAYLPMGSHLRQSPKKLLLWMGPLCLAQVLVGGLLCWALRLPTLPVLIPAASVTALAYTRSLELSLWKSGSVALSVCGVYACLSGIARAFDAMIVAGTCLAETELWLQTGTGLFYNLLCWLFTAIAYYPATNWAKTLIEDENFARTWYFFWIVPLVFIVLNLYIAPKQRVTLYTGRVLQIYFVVSLVLLCLLALFYGMFLMMANNLNKNSKLQQENHFLLLQQQRYESLRAAIEEARQARHDMRHHFRQLSALADAGELEKIKEYLQGAVSRIPNLDTRFSDNPAVDSVIGYYCALARQSAIPFRANIDLPRALPADEIDVCLVLSNLLENALEASLRTAPERRQILVEAYLHADRLVLIQVKNTFDGEILERNGVFQSSKRSASGIGIQSVRRLCEKNGGSSVFDYKNGEFTAKAMLRGTLQV